LICHVICVIVCYIKVKNRFNFTNSSSSESSTLNNDYDDAELRENKKRVDLHLNEIINTIYNESSRHYRSLKDYYAKRKGE